MGEAVYDFENNPKYIPSIKKNLLYERLYDFLEHYKNTENIELRILAWGKNFKSKEISKLLLKIISSIDTIDNTEILELSDLSNSLQYFRTLMERSFPKEDFNEILIKIEDEPITIYEFKKKLNQITESFIKYGKNIYSW